jgi:L-fuculose-phosphate aldolase
MRRAPLRPRVSDVNFKRPLAPLDFSGDPPSKAVVGRDRGRAKAGDMASNEKSLRESIIAHGASLVAAGLGGAPSGDISARFGDSLLITPSGAGYTSLRPAMIARMPLVGEYGSWKGPLKPSGEWRIHLDIARARPDIGAIVRFQSPYATALAMAHRDIPAAHSMIALFGGPVVRCAKYAPAGTTELAGLTLEALGGSHAVLLSNYCALATGATLGAAVFRARELETLARLYAIALSAGRPAILADDEVARIAERLKASGADVDARTVPPAKARAKAKTKAKAPPKRKRVARRRGSK